MGTWHILSACLLVFLLKKLIAYMYTFDNINTIVRRLSFSLMHVRVHMPSTNFIQLAVGCNYLL